MEQTEDPDMVDTEQVLTQLDPNFQGDILKSGVDLKAQKLEVERQLNSIETACIADYMRESDNITDLHERVTSCDEILKNLETILCKFQADLGNICQEIIVLHEQTVSLNIQLKNKQAIRTQLGKFIEDMSIPPTVILHIMYTSTSESAFLDNLILLDQKVHFFKEQDFKDAKSCYDVQQTLIGLKTKAIFKIREYILRKIQECRKYLKNYEVPQNSLIKNKFFYKFLLSHERERAREIQNEYIDTMSRVYHSYFKEYLHRLSKLEYDEKPDENDLMAVEDSHVKSRTSIIFNLKPSSLKNKSTVFTLGDRFSVLTTDLEAPLIMFNETKKDVKYTTESLFRTIHKALLDNAVREYYFIKEFFMTSGEAQTADLFQTVLGKTIMLLQTYVNEQFKNSFDTIAIFLCLHLVYRYRKMAHRREIFVLDFYWDSVVKCLYPRIEKMMQLQTKSVRGFECNKSPNVDTMPHPIVRKYAEYASAISSINETYPDERVTGLLDELQIEIKNFILRTAAVFVHPKEELIFMINNYDHILSVFKRSNVRKDSKDTEDIESQLNKRTQEIVEELLYPHFGSIICFVKDCEVFAERDDRKALKENEVKLAGLVRSFNSDWKEALDQISKEVMSNFSNFENGSRIQQATLTQIINYYDKFYNLAKGSPVKNELMNTHQFMSHIKKFKTLI